MIKKITIVLAMVILGVCLMACSSDKETEEDKPEVTSEVGNEVTEEPTEEVTPEADKLEIASTETWGDYTVGVPKDWTFRKGDAFDENDTRYCSVKKSDFKYFDFKMEEEQVANNQYNYNKNTYTNEQEDVSGKYGNIDWTGFQYSDGFGGYGFELIGNVDGVPVRVSSAGFKFDSDEAKLVLNSLVVKPSVTATPEPTEEVAEVTAEPTAEPTDEPIIAPENPDTENDVEEALDFSDVTEEGRELTADEIKQLARTLSNASSDRAYYYMNAEISMDYAGQQMDIIMTETMYMYDNIQHAITNTNMFGSDMNIENYLITDEDGNSTSYMSYDGTNWMKSEGGSIDISTINANEDEFAESFKDGRVVETTDGYTVTGTAEIDSGTGFIVPLYCEIFLDTEGKLKRYNMTLKEPFSGEEEGTNYTVNKLDIEFEADCPEIEIPEEVLNAGDYDMSGLIPEDLLDGLVDQ